MREAHFDESALPSFFGLLDPNNDFAAFRAYMALQITMLKSDKVLSHSYFQNLMVIDSVPSTLLFFQPRYPLINNRLLKFLSGLSLISQNLLLAISLLIVIRYNFNDFLIGFINGRFPLRDQSKVLYLKSYKRFLA